MAELQVPVLCAGCPNLILCEKSLVIFKIEKDNRISTKYLNKCFFPLYINKITGTCTLLSLSIQVTCKVSVLSCLVNYELQVKFCTNFFLF